MEQSGSLEPAGVRGRQKVESSTDAISGILREMDLPAESASENVYTSAVLVTAARRICDAARRDGLYIEQAIVRVKTAWRATPGRAKPRSGGTDVQLDQLVSICIREFYTER